MMYSISVHDHMYMGLIHLIHRSIETYLALGQSCMTYHPRHSFAMCYISHRVISPMMAVRYQKQIGVLR